MSVSDDNERVTMEAHKKWLRDDQTRMRWAIGSFLVMLIFTVTSFVVAVMDRFEILGRLETAERNLAECRGE